MALDTPARLMPALALVVATALAGCLGGGDDPPTADDPDPATGGADPATADPLAAGPTPTIVVYYVNQSAPTPDPAPAEPAPAPAPTPACLAGLRLLGVRLGCA